MRPVISADANFGLVRKISAGKAIEALPRDFFLDQATVDSFLATYTNPPADKDNVSFLNLLVGKNSSLLYHCMLRFVDNVFR